MRYALRSLFTCFATKLDLQSEVCSNLRSSLIGGTLLELKCHESARNFQILFSKKRSFLNIHSSITIKIICSWTNFRKRNSSQSSFRSAISLSHRKCSSKTSKTLRQRQQQRSKTKSINLINYYLCNSSSSSSKFTKQLLFRAQQPLNLVI